jgi:hypothetical protein
VAPAAPAAPATGGRLGLVAARVVAATVAARVAVFVAGLRAVGAVAPRATVDVPPGASVAVPTAAAFAVVVVMGADACPASDGASGSGGTTKEDVAEAAIVAGASRVAGAVVDSVRSARGTGPAS